MPKVVEYTLVLKRMEEEGYVCNYHNSGAFGLRREVKSEVVAWAGPEDPTIRPEARRFVQFIAQPWESQLAQMAMQAWQQWLPGALWVMPKSHWAFELDFSGGAWLCQGLEEAGLDPARLAGLNNASAIEFATDERGAAENLVATLLARLSGSDFMLAYPSRGTICTLHHHKQLWWVITDERLAERLRELGRQRAPLTAG